MHNMTDPQADYSVAVHPQPVGRWESDNIAMALAAISDGEAALERAVELADIVTLRDKAEAVGVFLIAQHMSEAAQKAKILQLRSERKAGIWLSQHVRPGNPQLSPNGIISTLPDGIDAKQSHRWQLEASLPEDRFNEWVDECLAHAWELSAGALRKIAEAHNGKQQRADDVIGWLARRIVLLKGADLTQLPVGDANYIWKRLDEIAERLAELAERPK